MQSMIKYILIFYILIGTTHAQEYFTTTYGGSYLEQLTKMRPTTDGGYVMVGSTDSYGPNAGSLGTNYYIVKTDATGLQQWATALGGMNTDFPYDVRQTNDGGYIVFGYTTSFSSLIEAMLVRLDQSGQILWAKTYSASTNVEGYCVFEKANANFILAGVIEIPVSTAKANWIAETDAQGNLVRSYNYQSSFGDRITDIDTTHDGNFLICGYTATPWNNETFLFKLDTAINAIWYVREYSSSTHITRAHAIRELSNGSIVIAGGSSANESNQYVSDMMMYKFDSSGNAQGGVLYGQTGIYEMAYDLWADPMSKKLYANGEVNDQLNQLGLTIVADSEMTMIDVVNPGFGKLNYDQRTSSITRNADRSFSLSGQTNETGGGDFFLALRDSNLQAVQACHGMSLGPYSSWNAPLQWLTPQPYTPINAAITANDITPQVANGGMVNFLCSTVSNEELSEEHELLRIYPNPSTGKFSIELLRSGVLQIYDMMGREVFSHILPSGFSAVDVELENGIYWVNVGGIKGKMIIRK